MTPNLREASGAWADYIHRVKGLTKQESDLLAAIEAEPAQTRSEVEAFMQAMEAKLQTHDNDRGTAWKRCSVSFLWDRLEEELDELAGAYHQGDDDAARKECVDVANFVMMLWDRLAPAIEAEPADSPPLTDSGDCALDRTERWLLEQEESLQEPEKGSGGLEETEPDDAIKVGDGVSGEHHPSQKGKVLKVEPPSTETRVYVRWSNWNTNWCDASDLTKLPPELPSDHLDRH